MWHKDKEQIKQRLNLAEDAVRMSQVSYMAAITIDREAQRVERGHIRLQHENHFSQKLYGKDYTDE